LHSRPGRGMVKGVNPKTRDVVDMSALQAVIEQAWAQPHQAEQPAARRAVSEVIALLDRGALRVAEPAAGGWRVHGWIQMAILLYFRQRDAESSAAGPLRFRDRIPIKNDLAQRQVRVVPPGTARYGSYLAPGVVLMPGYVNIGAYVGEGTMIDTWATVGSGAQVGREVHISGGVGIGGVLEPPQAMPVIIEDGVFVGSRCILVEGVRVEAGAVLGAGVVLTGSTPIVDVRGGQAVVYRGRVPAATVVIPGSWPRSFPAGEFHTPCALLIGERRPSTDAKTQLNEILREFPLELR
jgi:2,3,4,5-tetrahydropyridine-2,6-dicarboxylate N-succinyltransferase